MGSELPGGNKRKTKWSDNRSADKYYASGNLTTQNQGSQDSVKSNTQHTQAPLPKREDRSADKYYRNTVPKGKTREQAAADLRKSIKQHPPIRAVTPQRPHIVPVSTESSKFNGTQVSEIIDNAIAKLHSGVNPVIITVPQGAADLLKKLRTAAELRVTREEITEDEFQSLRFVYEQSEVSKNKLDIVFGPPQPTSEVSTKVNEDVEDDSLSFLTGANPVLDDPIVDTSAQVPTEQVVTEEPTHTPSPVEDGNDAFFTPAQAEVSSNNSFTDTLEKLTQQTEPIEPVAPIKPGKKSGRK
jgi:hypothetical protein